MRRTLVFSILWSAIVIAVVIAEALWFASPSVERGNVRSIEQHLVRKLRDAAEDKKLGSAALVLIERGKVVAEHGFGVPNAEKRPYQLASVSKAVTAWGVMNLVENGWLRLDEPVMRHLTRWRFPGSEQYRDRVTVRHLLSHTAGLDDGLGYGGFAPGERVQTLEESLTSAEDSTVGKPREVQIVREPGTSFAYSGGGYTVLQLLIEEVTGQPFAVYMKQSVLQPLGMKQSTFDWNEATDLVPAFDHDVDPKPARRHVALAAVSLYATPRDIAQWVIAFRGNPLLSQETIRQMLTPQPGTSGAWGLGHTLFGDHVVGHDGGSPPAWGAMVRFNPATGNGMVLMLSGGRGAVNQLPHDWHYWETGKITTEARRQMVYRRIVPASAAIVLGVILFLVWSRFTSSRTTTRA